MGLLYSDFGQQPVSAAAAKGMNKEAKACIESVLSSYPFKDYPIKTSANFGWMRPQGCQGYSVMHKKTDKSIFR